ncbi:MAG TPA: tetratricopeptide repeat protein [Novosphingobium sp.]|nr:tetratricopeptide repeat protein [Novosphingobium sp.]
MTWLIVIGLALVVFGVIAFAFRLPRSAWEVIGAALLLGIAGYAFQGSPGQAGSPKAPTEKVSGGASAAEITEREKLAAGDVGGDKHVIIADALARHGQYADAAEVLRGAVEQNPGNAPAWLAMGNALVAHADGTISPAAIYAYGQAARAAPGSAGPPFFLGMALIQSGRLAEGRAIWADLLTRSPKDAPWRGDLEKRLGELDTFLAQRQAAGDAAEMPSR